MAILIILLILPAAIAATRTFRVKETDFIRIRPVAMDADRDTIVYTFSPPLDEHGEWQTTLDDAGEYEITITASDEVHQTEEKVLLLVANKNQPPFLTQSKVTARESESIDLKQFVDDPDDDLLTFHFMPPFDGQGVWRPGYTAAGTTTAAFFADDGEFNVPLRMDIEVLNSNQLPVITKSFSNAQNVALAENETMVFWAEATDNDDDELTYTWEFDGVVISQYTAGEHYLSFEMAGSHNLTLVMGDGLDEVKQQWIISVEDVNRPPALSLAPVTVEEGDMFKVEVPETDEDGDILSYSFEPPLDEQGEWEVGYDDAGTVEVEVTASDGSANTTTLMEITVLDVDLAPTLIVPPDISAWEGQEVTLPIDTGDPDGDTVRITVENLPEGAAFDTATKTLSWIPSYDTLKRKGGFMSNVLNTLRLERFFLRRGTFSLLITSCGKQLCSSETVSITVHNVNRPPAFVEAQGVVAQETEEVKLEVVAVDPDGDILHYYFTDPLGKTNGEWKTDFGDEAVYETYVTATDGDLGTTIPLRITVLKKNRQPRLRVTPDEVTVREGETFKVQVQAEDPDGDDLLVGLKELPPGASFVDDLFTWAPGHDTVASSDGVPEGKAGGSLLRRWSDRHEKVVWLEFVASDGEYDSTYPLKVKVKNVNREPEIIDYLPAAAIRTAVGQPIVFHAVVKDPDQDNLTLRWEFDPGLQIITGTDTIRRTFTAPGTKKVRFTASDSQATIAREWLVVIQRPPEPPKAQPSPASAAG